MAGTRNFGLHLEISEANGARRGRLPLAKNIRLQYPAMDQAVLTFDYPPTGRKADLLLEPCDIRVWFSPTGTDGWLFPGPKFLHLADDRDRALGATGMYAITCASWDFHFSKARVLQEGDTGGVVTGIWDPATGPRVFTGVTVGTILGQLFVEKASRSSANWTLVGSDIGPISTAVHDSAGVAWPATLLDREYTQGTSFREVLADLTQEGHVTWEVRDTSLYIYSPDGPGLETDAYQWGTTAATTDLTIIQPDAATAIPTRRTWEAHADRLYQEGDSGVGNLAYNPSTAGPWGVWEEYSTHGGAADDTELAALATKHFTDNPSPVAESVVTVTLSSTDGRGCRPFLDYRPGQAVRLRDTPGTVPSVGVVKSISLEEAGGQWTSAITLDRRILPRDVNAARELSTLGRGQTLRYSSYIGSTGPPPKPLP